MRKQMLHAWLLGVTLGAIIAAIGGAIAYRGKPAAPGMIPKIEIGTTRTSLIVYSNDPDATEDVRIECTDANYVLPRGNGQKFWVVEMPTALTHCYTSQEVFIWPIFEFRPEE